MHCNSVGQRLGNERQVQYLKGVSAVKGGRPHFPDHRKNERGIPKRRKIYLRILLG